MKQRMKLNIFAAGICMAALASTAHAEEPALNLELPAAASMYTNNSRFINARPYQLALNEGDVAKDQVDMSAAPSAEFEPPLFSGSKAHQYLGLGTVLLVGLTALSAPDEDCENNCPAASPPRQTSGTTHTRLARTAAALAAATVTTGLLYHWDDFHLEDGLSDPDNQHAMLGAAGALLMLYAVNKSAKSAVPTSHAGYAELGGVAMAVAIKLTW
ncbi:MAG: hypothetical protein ACOY9D_09160 [Pseudomonadota bacterium]